MARLTASLLALGALALLGARTAFAQDAPPPAGSADDAAADAPELVLEAGEPVASLEPDEALIRPPTLTEAPGASRLEPQPEEREDALEVVIVRGRSDWRLPDLGTSLRQQREAEERANQRIHVDFLPLHDPANEDPALAMFDEPDPRGVGWINIFEVEVGRNRD